MKKTRILVSSLLAAVMLVGAGYAAWTDNLTIKNTVSTGELNVKFVETSLTSQENDAKYLKNVSITKTSNANTENVKDIIFTLNNMYPGSSAKLDAKILNSGTIPAVIKSVNYSTDIEETLNGINNAILKNMSKDEKSLIEVKGSINVYDNNDKSIKTIPVTSNLRDLGENLNTSPLIDLKLEPNYTVKFENMIICLPIDAKIGNDENIMENKYVKCSMTLNFQQHNTK